MNATARDAQAGDCGHADTTQLVEDEARAEDAGLHN